MGGTLIRETFIGGTSIEGTLILELIEKLNFF
jgi:hypothetical protein